MSDLHDRIVDTLNRAGAQCGECAREPGDDTAYCADCNEVLNLYATRLAPIIRDAHGPLPEVRESDGVYIVHSDDGKFPTVLRPVPEPVVPTYTVEKYRFDALALLAIAQKIEEAP